MAVLLLFFVLDHRVLVEVQLARYVKSLLISIISHSQLPSSRPQDLRTRQRFRHHHLDQVSPRDHHLRLTLSLTFGRLPHGFLPFPAPRLRSLFLHFRKSLFGNFAVFLDDFFAKENYLSPALLLRHRLYMGQEIMLLWEKICHIQVIV